MSEPVVESPVNQDPVAQETVNEAPYANQLNSLPESVRPLVEPIFKEWDANTTKKFQDLHSTTEPWKDLIDGYEPTTVKEALQLAQMLEDNPKELWDTLATYFKFGVEQGTPAAPVTAPPVAEELDETDLFSDPRLKEMQQAVQQMANILVNNQQLATAQEQQKALDGVLAGLKEKHGEIDEDYILNRLVLGDDPDTAVANWNSSIERAIQARGLSASGGAPVVAPGNGGGTPSVVDGSKKLGELSTSEVTDHVAQMLRQAAEANK